MDRAEPLDLSAADPPAAEPLTAELQAAARELVERLREALPVSAVILFGSRARGDHTQESDLDVAVVSPEFTHEPRMFRRVARLMDAVPRIRRLDLVGLAPEELAALDCLLVLDIVAEGRPLYDAGLYDETRQSLAAKLRSGAVERLPGGWRIGPANPHAPLPVSAAR